MPRMTGMYAWVLIIFKRKMIATLYLANNGMTFTHSHHVAKVEPGGDAPDQHFQH